MEDKNLIKAIVEIAREAQIKQTKDVLHMIEGIPETPEITELKERLKIADENIHKQCDFVLKLDRIVKKSALLN